jgi:hypothetical protein
MTEKPNKSAQSIPALAEWPGDPLDWLRLFGSLDHAEAFATLFWPAFVRHDGCTFLELDEKIYADWLTTLKGDKTRVEATMNHRHICDMLPCPERATTRGQITSVGKLLRETWSAKLRNEFPAEGFTVRFSEDYSEDLIDYYITLFRNRDPIN